MTKNQFESRSEFEKHFKKSLPHIKQFISDNKLNRDHGDEFEIKADVYKEIDADNPLGKAWCSVMLIGATEIDLIAIFYFSFFRSPSGTIIDMREPFDRKIEHSPEKPFDINEYFEEKYHRRVILKRYLANRKVKTK